MLWRCEHDDCTFFRCCCDGGRVLGGVVGNSCCFGWILVSGGMRLVQCGGPIGAGPPEIDGGEPWPYSIKILDCWFWGIESTGSLWKVAPFPCLLLSLSERS